MPKRQPLFALVLCCGALLSACTDGQAQSRSEPATTSKVLATVNGEPITEGLYKAYVQHRYPEQAGQLVEAILQELINIELVAQAARQQGLEDKPGVAADLAYMEKNYLTGLAVREMLEDNPVSQEQLKATYDEAFAEQRTEYKARHILVPSREDAEAAIDQLEKGADFAEVAKEKSTDSSAAAGGDLGWFSPEQMVAPFSQATAALEPGKHTKEPVQTQFGWHVIKLEDTRKAEPPPMAQVEDQLRSHLQGRQVQEFVEGLREKAKIDLKQQAAQGQQ